MLCTLLILTASGLYGLSAHPARDGPPRAQLLEPGFQARALPVQLTNANALAFGPDGRLYVLGYDGRIHRLIDTDGDGLEDRAAPYWDREGLISPVALVWGPDRILYVASHQKISRLVDTNGDGRADQEEVVAAGWPKIPSGSGLVDAMGLAFDGEGRLYFGLGCADFTNPYLLRDGIPGYQTDSELGAILRLSPDGQSREIFATGFRFTYALKFNRAGDLFATDQEGETWLRGGNPLDELDQVQPGRHYGWPPRHEAYLPEVRDEPPIIGFRPQHQSACGLVFNEPTKGNKLFGHEDWEGDAFVALFSRGRVNRVSLVKTLSGYIGRDVPFATFNRMPVDLTISPDGALYVALHSGDPDWGTGPGGPGVLLRIEPTPSAPLIPRPVAAWAVSPIEVRVAFDTPLEPDSLAELPGQRIHFGRHLRAGTRFETIKPPYKAVEAEQAETRGSIAIASARLDDAGKTLILSTDPHPWAATYSLVLPTLRGTVGGPSSNAELEYTLEGVEAEWQPLDSEIHQPAPGSPMRLAWPHPDPLVVAQLTRGSRAHSSMQHALSLPGMLTLRTILTLPTRASFTVHASGSIRFEEGSLAGAEGRLADDGRTLSWNELAEHESIELFLVLRTGAMSERPASIDVSYHAPSDPTTRPLPLSAFRLPWAPSPPFESAPAAQPPPALAGGDPARGRAVFLSDSAKCASCHLFRGAGKTVGPDLSNLHARDLASIFRDIAEPSATINPDYVPFTVSLKDGRVLAGIVRSDGPDALIVIDTDARETRIARNEIDEIRPAATSIMPVGLAGALGEQQLKDLLAFLTQPQEE